MAQKYTDDEILEALLSAGSARQAAKRLGCSLSCVRDRMAKPRFKERYDRAKADALADTVCNLQARMSTAVDVLAVMMVNPEIAATVRVSAADSILRHGLRYVEQFEIIRRIERLEASTKNEEVDV